MTRVIHVDKDTAVATARTLLKLLGPDDELVRSWTSAVRELGAYSVQYSDRLKHHILMEHM